MVSRPLEGGRGVEVCLADWGLSVAGSLCNAAAGEEVLGRGPAVCLVAAAAASADEAADRAAAGTALSG